MNLVKLTRQNGIAIHGILSGPWEVGTRREIAEDKRKPQLCTDGILHAYRSVELALLINPIMGNIDNPKLWSAVGDVVVSDLAKVGCYSLTITEALETPEWYTDETKRRNIAIMFALLCAEAVDSDSPDGGLRKAIEIAKKYIQAKDRGARATVEADAKLAWVESDAKLAMIETDTETARSTNAGIASVAHYTIKAVAYPLWTDLAAAEVAFFASGIIGSVDFDELARQAVAMVEANK